MTRTIVGLLTLAALFAVGGFLFGCGSDGPATVTGPPASSLGKSGSSGTEGATEPITEVVESETPDFGTMNDPFELPHEPERLVVLLDVGFDYADLEAQFGVVLLETVGDYGVLSVPATVDLKDTAQAMVDAGYVHSAEPSSIYYLGLEVIIGFFESDPLEAGVVPDPDWQQRTDLPYLHSFVTGLGTTIAVLDTGVGADEGTPLTTSVASGGWDFVDADDLPHDEPGGRAWGHGTLVADIARQVAPGAQILPLRVMNPAGEALAIHVADALHHAIVQGADVVNLSFGGQASVSYVEDALAACTAAGVMVVGSAGNDGSDDDKHYPSSSTHVCSVAATNANDERAPFSSYGVDIEVCAPGDGIVGQGPGRKLAIGVGTSFSSPMTAGAAACKMQAATEMGPAQFRSALTSSSMPMLEDDAYRAGLLAGRIDFDGFLFTAR